jgi:hypothetical protein
MSTIARSLRLIAAGSLLAALAACNSTSNTTSISLSGNVTGLTDTGLVLSNGISLVTVNSGATGFTFPSRVLIGSQYSVQVASLPPTLICTVANGSGIATNNSDISNVQVTCVARNNLGGTITGLAAAGLILANGNDTVRPAAGAQSFTFGGKVGQGFSYGVTVLQQPTGETCSVSNGAGVMGTGDVNSVQVNCQ